MQFGNVPIDCFFFHLCATIGIYLTWFRSVLFIILTSVSRRYANLSVVPSSGAISFRYASLTVVVHTLIETDTSSKREKLCHCFPEDINYAIIKSLYNWHHQMGDQPRNSVVRRIYNTREFFFYSSVHVLLTNNNKQRYKTRWQRQ